MKSFQKLPPQFQCAEVKEYYDILCKKQGSFVLKRILDIFASVIIVPESHATPHTADPATTRHLPDLWMEAPSLRSP